MSDDREMTEEERQERQRKKRELRARLRMILVSAEQPPAAPEEEG